MKKKNEYQDYKPFDPRTVSLKKQITDAVKAGDQEKAHRLRQELMRQK